VANPNLEFRKYLNFLLNLLERRQNASVLATNPFDVTIDPSTICQLECPYCEVGNGSIKRGRSLLSPTTHRSYVAELAADMFVAWYFSTGEPLINRRFADIVSAIRDRGVFPIVSTNLSLRLSDARIDELLTCGLGVICVSLDGASPETYVRYRIKGDFALVVDNVARLIRRKRELGLDLPLIEWRFLVFRHNQHELPLAREAARDLEVDVLEFFPGSAPPGAAHGAVQLSDPVDLSPVVSGPAIDLAVDRADTTLRRALHGHIEGSASAPADLTGRKCDWLYFGAMLFPRGAVGPCCVSNHEPDDFGRIESGSGFRDVWNNANFQEARSMFVRPAPSNLICARCPLTEARDYQFRSTLRAILRNAPDWAMWILAQEPDRFFFDIDFALCPMELGAIRNHSLALRPPSHDVFARVDAALLNSDISLDRVSWLRRYVKHS